jgi:hypothetical protein
MYPLGIFRTISRPSVRPGRKCEAIKTRMVDLITIPRIHIPARRRPAISAYMVVKGFNKWTAFLKGTKP